MNLYKNRPPQKKSGPKGADALIPNSPEASADSLSTQADDPVERKYFRQSLLLIGGTFLVMLLFFAAAFFLAVRGAERTVVPQVVGMKLTEALVSLQERELYPRLQVKYTGTPADKGLILSQDPEAGLYVKAGRRVTITVSRGAVVDSVQDYVGRNVEEVRSHLVSLFSTYEPLLIIREPITYVYDDSEPGTVLLQSPTAGTPLSRPEELILIVSRGSLDRPLRIDDWKGWSVDHAIRSMAGMPLPFVFDEAPGDSAGTSPRVVSQSPEPASEVLPGRLVSLRFTRPASVSRGSKYGLFNYTLPSYPVPVLLEAVILEPGSEERVLFSMPHPGGRVSFPYIVPVGSGVILKVNGREVHRLDILADE